MSSDMGDYGGFDFSPSFSFGTGSGGFSTGSGSVPAYSGASGGGLSGGSPSFGGLSSGSGGAAFGLTPGVTPSDTSFPDPTSSASGATPDGTSAFGERFGEWGPWGGDFSTSGQSLGGPQNPFEGGGQPVPFQNMQWPAGGVPPSGQSGEQTFGYNSPASDIQGLPGWDQPFMGAAPREAPWLPGVGASTDFSAARRTPSAGGSPPPSEQKTGGSFLDRLAEGAIGGLTRNPLGIAASGAGLAINMLRGNKDPEGLAQLREAADNLKSTGSILQQYLTTGTLPPGMQASVDAATKAAKASLIQRHAARGLPADPSRNSALQQELAQLEQNAIITGATLGDKLMTQGLSASGLSSQLYQAIMNLDRERSKQTSQAIANFASALGGGGGGNPTKGTLTFG